MNILSFLKFDRLQGIKSHRIITFMMLLLFLVSCSTTRLYNKTDKDHIADQEKFDRLNGLYSNSGNSPTQTLYDIVYDRDFDREGLNTDSIRVKITTINNKKIEIQFLSHGICLNTLYLDGKYKNGYFLTKQFDLFTPIFPLVWGPQTYKMSFGTTKNGDLIILESLTATTLLIVFPFFASGDDHVYDFKRIKE
jgi:hypothetical protein